jgi:hypothetical protein
MADAPKVAPVVLTLLRDDHAALILHEDGKLDVGGQQSSAGTLRADGRFLDPKGKLLARLTSDGEVVLANGEYLPVTIDADGTAHLPKEQRTLRLRVDGSVEGANPDGPVVRFEGLSANNRRTAMFMLVLAAFPVKKQ